MPAHNKSLPEFPCEHCAKLHPVSRHFENQEKII